MSSIYLFILRFWLSYMGNIKRVSQSTHEYRIAESYDITG